MSVVGAGNKETPKDGSDNDSLVSEYNDIDDEVLTPSRTDEKKLFIKERRKKKRLDVYALRLIMLHLSLSYAEI